MNLRKSIIVFFLLFSFTTAAFSQEKDLNKKVEELLSKMTLKEKIGQMTQYPGFPNNAFDLAKQGKAGSFFGISDTGKSNELQKTAVEQSRLGIPIIFGADVIHGFKTIFPIPLAEACSWNPELVSKSAAIAAKEAKILGGIHWTFAPMVDVARDPRWGRIAEGSGEDSYLGSVMAAARIDGFQGKNLADPETILACLKHYVAYGGAEAGKDYNTVDVSERTLREVYLPPFKAGVERGALSVMTSFNTINGIPATGNRFTITEILRNEWKFRGLVVSDYDSVKELVAHGFAENYADAAVKALYAGVDMDMSSEVYLKNLPKLVKSGKVSEKAIDDAVKRILRLKFMLGLFEKPYAVYKNLKTKDHYDHAREIARQSIVLLKNNNVLPITMKTKSIAVIGPLANNKEDMLGSWMCVGNKDDVVTIFEGIKKKLSSSAFLKNIGLRYAKGCDIKGESLKGFADAIKIARKSDLVILVVGESNDMSGEAASRCNLDLPGRQKDLIKIISKTKKPIVVVLVNGRPLTINWTAKNIPAIVEAWQLGTQTGNAVADILFGDYNPSGKLAITFPRCVGQIPIYYNHEMTGRPPSREKWSSKYIDMPVIPLYPFGYGLSYTRFEYSNLKLNKESIAPDGTVKVSADIRNVGRCRGEEVVQLYIRDVTASVVRPVKELKGFKKISLNPGEKKTVTFRLGPEELGFYNQNMDFVVEGGTFYVWVAWNSSTGLKGSFKVRED